MQEDERGEHADKAVGTKEIAVVQQDTVHGAIRNQRQVAPYQQSPHRDRRRASRFLAPGELNQSVAEHDGEHGIRASVDCREHQEIQRALDAVGVWLET